MKSQPPSAPVAFSAAAIPSTSIPASPTSSLEISPSSFLSMDALSNVVSPVAASPASIWQEATSSSAAQEKTKKPRKKIDSTPDSSEDDFEPDSEVSFKNFFFSLTQ